jgi:DNA-directed RNA polymerase specialized sigma24 family protein
VLEQLCRTYWYPIYAYARRTGLTPADAEDLTQEFFARLLAGNSLSRADPAKGRVRSYLLAGLKHLLCDERKKAGRLKGGGGRSVVPLDEVEAVGAGPVAPDPPVAPQHPEDPARGAQSHAAMHLAFKTVLRHPPTKVAGLGGRAMRAEVRS